MDSGGVVIGEVNEIRFTVEYTRKCFSEKNCNDDNALIIEKEILKKDYFK